MSRPTKLEPRLGLSGSLARTHTTRASRRRPVSRRTQVSTWSLLSSCRQRNEKPWRAQHVGLALFLPGPLGGFERTQIGCARGRQGRGARSMSSEAHSRISSNWARSRFPGGSAPQAMLVASRMHCSKQRAASLRYFHGNSARESARRWTPSARRRRPGSARGTRRDRRTKPRRLRRTGSACRWHFFDAPEEPPPEGQRAIVQQREGDQKEPEGRFRE